MTIDLPIYTPGERLALFKATLQKLATIWITNQYKGVIAKDLSEAEIKLLWIILAFPDDGTKQAAITNFIEITSAHNKDVL